MINRLKIRWKLTLWYGCVLAIVLSVFGTAVFVIMRHHLMQRIDQGLNEELTDVLSEVRRAKTTDSLKDYQAQRRAVLLQPSPCRSGMAVAGAKHRIPVFGISNDPD
jgi:hypothetical protein